MNLISIPLLGIIIIAGCTSQNIEINSTSYENLTGEIRFNSLEEAFNSQLSLKCTSYRSDIGWEYNVTLSGGKIKLEYKDDLMMARSYVEKVRNLTLPQRLKGQENESYVNLLGAYYTVITETEYLAWKETQEQGYPNFNITILKSTSSKDKRRIFFDDKSFIGSQFTTTVCTTATIPASVFTTPPWQGSTF